MDETRLEQVAKDGLRDQAGRYSPGGGEVGDGSGDESGSSCSRFKVESGWSWLRKFLVLFARDVARCDLVRKRTSVLNSGGDEGRLMDGEESLVRWKTRAFCCGDVLRREEFDERGWTPTRGCWRGCS